MQASIEKIKQAIEPLRQEIVHHKVYGAIKDLEDVKIFMQNHVYAVWDFMSLLKALQNNLTCTSVPWFPVGNADTRFLINEIVVGEESDVDADGIRMSHFELYLKAMKQSGADTHPIETFISSLQTKSNLTAAFEESNTPPSAREFVDFTFKMIESQQSHLQSAIFTFGREDLIPGMFISMVNDLHKQFPHSIDVFKYYLERHIEVDGDHHSHLALNMTAQLCGNDESLWAEAEKVSIESLQKRLQLWDGVYEAIQQRKS
jgi:hypothetical protein